MKLTGNTILITGGTSGLGLGFASELIKLGNKVIICGRREDRLKEISVKYPEITTRKSDISVDSERRSLVDWTLDHFPGLNMIINNAGIQTNQPINIQMDLSKVQQEVDTNFVAPIHLCALLTDHLKGKENAAIINISSGLAFVPLAFLPIYCATKAGIHSFTLSLRYLLRESGVRVFEIVPPAVDTELGRDRRTDGAQSHGGISVDEFIKDTMEALSRDEFEAAIGSAINLREKKELMFSILNK